MRAHLRTILAMTVAGLGIPLASVGPVAAISVESGRAHIFEFPSFTRTSHAVFEGPDLLVSFTVHHEPLRGGVSADCFFVDCEPLRAIRAFAVGERSDVPGFVLGLQTGSEATPACLPGTPCPIQACPPNGLPSGAFGPFCASFRVRMMWSSELPLFGGHLEGTLPGTFEAMVSVGIFSPFGAGPPPPGFSFSVTGPALFHVAWNPETEGWRFLSADGRIEPTPEPATLLLFGTTAAGLGLARWYRRRERAHAA